MRSKNKTANSTTVIIKLYTTTVILQLLFWRAPDSITFSFLTLYKIFRKAFETPLNDCVWLAEYGKIYTSYFQGENSKCDVKACILKSF